MPRKLATSVFLLLLFSSAIVHAQNKKGPALTEPPKNDLNFALMGEFVGPITTGENEYEPLALQLRPIGGDNFEAVSFKGGLPGQNKHQPHTIKMIGRRSGDFLVLSGGPWAIFVEKDHCLIIDRTGKQLGRLERVQRTSPTIGARPPKDAVVIFDGNNIDQFTKAQMTADGLLMQGADFKPMFQDFNLHLEFLIPYMPQAQGQGRGNSGVYLQSRYECQVLDSFALDSLINGLGALYQFKKPDVNMAFPPLTWQTYDIQFTAPRWAADGSKVRDAHVTSWINGVKVQNNVALPNKTGAGKQEEPVLTPIRLQDHGDPVRFRNIWLVDRGLTMTPFPVYPPKEAAEPAKETAKPPAEEEAAKKPESKKEQPKKEANQKDAKPEPNKPEPKKDTKPEPNKPEPNKEAEAKGNDKQPKPNDPPTDEGTKPADKPQEKQPENQPPAAPAS